MTISLPLALLVQIKVHPKYLSTTENHPICKKFTVSQDMTKTYPKTWFLAEPYRHCEGSPSSLGIQCSYINYAERKEKKIHKLRPGFSQLKSINHSFPQAF